MYESFYKLSAKPFQLTPDASFFFPSKSHRRALAYLRYGVSQGEGFVVVTGGVGTGKSTLVQALLAETGQHHSLVAASIVTTQLEEQELLRMTAANLGLSYSGIGKTELVKNIETFLQDCNRRGKRVLLIVDEAQNLAREGLEELRMLSNFQSRGRPILQTFLLGQDQLRRNLAVPEAEQLRQRITASHHLEALNLSETQEYIEHRLTCAGWDGDPSFQDGTWELIHAFTGGVPRRINTYMERLLLHGFLEQLHDFGVEVVTHIGEELLDEKKHLEQNDAWQGGEGAAGEPAPALDFQNTDALAAQLASMNATLRDELGQIRQLLEKLVK